MIEKTKPQLSLGDWEERQKVLQKLARAAEMPSFRARRRNPKASDTARSNHDLHRIWANMKQRCNNPNNTHYKWYGGRGIQVCERWNQFLNFVADMGPRPTSAHTIDRIDNEKNYSPENCRWATRKQQGANRRGLHILEYNGERLMVTQWADRIGIVYVGILNRLKRGWSVERAVTTPSLRR